MLSVLKTIRPYNFYTEKQRESIRYCEVDEDCIEKDYSLFLCGDWSGCFDVKVVRMILSTHFHSAIASLKDDPRVEMQRALFHGITPLYMFENGVSDGGYAVKFARHLGMPEGIMRRIEEE